MKRTLMIGVAAGALLAGVNLAAAQGMQQQQPAAQQQQPAASGGASVEQKSGAEMKGGKELKGGKARVQAQGDVKAGGELKAQDATQPGEKKGKKAQKAAQKEQTKSGTSAQGDVKSGSDTKAGTSAQGDTKASGSATTTGQSAGGAAKASLTPEQKTKVRETVFKSGPRVTNVNFSISVGTVIPRTVRYAPLPPILVEYYPHWRGYEYFIVEEEIIIIEPRTLKIVAVLNV